MNISNLIQAWAQRRPERTALVFGSQRLSYLELEHQVAACAECLHAQGVRRGARVAILLGNTPDFVCSFFAVVRLGAVATLLDLSLKPHELHRRLAIARADALIADSALATALQTVKPQPSEHRLPRLLMNARSAGMVRNGEAPPPARDDESGAEAILQFSSGTTGQSKCLSRTHGQLLGEFSGFCAGADVFEGERVLCPVSLSHAHGLCNGMLAALLSGGTLVLVKSLVPHQILKLLGEEQITIMPCVPFILEVLLHGRAGADLAPGKLRLCLSAGAILRQETYDGIQEKFGIRVRQLYGTTETGAIAFNPSVAAPGPWNSVGRPLPSTEVRIVDAEGGPCPAGVEGEVTVKSPNMFQGYENSGHAGPSVFRDGFFRTGDLGFLDRAGNLHLVGRIKLLINVAGRKVNPAEVEEVILKHPKIKEAVVLGVRADTAGKWAEECVKACLVARPGCSILEIHEFCGRHLARYQVPKIIEFRREIPKSATGKVLRNALIGAN